MGYMNSELSPRVVSVSEPPVKKREKLKLMKILIFFLAGTGFLIAAKFLINIAQKDPDWLTQVYIPFSLGISETLSNVSKVFPFSLAEMILYLVLAGVLIIVAAFFVKAARHTFKFRYVLTFLSAIYMASACIVFLYCLFWGLNYYAPSIGEQIGLIERPTSKETLLNTTIWLREKMNEYANQVPRGDGGACSFGYFDEVAAGAADGFKELSEVIPRFAGAYNIPKRIFSWPVFSKAGIWGIYIPLTGEANVNPDVPDASLPFTMCHEMAHRLAVAPEQDTNFAAFLASIHSNSPIYRYSGYFSAFVYCYNAVAESYPQELQSIAGGIDPLVLEDFLALTEHNKENEGTVREFATSVNDTYLRSMSQDDGVLSYGRVVDLIIAYFLAETDL